MYKNRFMKKRVKRTRKAQTAGSRALKIVRQINKRTEIKYVSNTYGTSVSTQLNIDNSAGGGGATHIPIITDVGAVSTGDTTTTRTGNYITPKSLRILGTFRPNGTTLTGTTGTSAVLAMLIRDTQQVAGSNPTITQIFGSATQGAFSLPSIAVANRFQVLWRRRYIVNGQAGNSIVIDKSIRLKKSIQFNGTSATSSFKDGLYFVLFGDQGTTTSQPSGYLETRLSFVDD